MKLTADEFRKNYKNFIYKDYKALVVDDFYLIEYTFEIANLDTFKHTIKIPRNIINCDINQDMFNYIVFNVGMIELISYWKLTASYNIVIEAGYLNKRQIEFFNKIYYLGLGEYRYLNKINLSQKNFFNIKINHKKSKCIDVSYKGEGNLIPIGGGKDSCVTLELLKGLNNTCFCINPKSTHKKCIEQSKEESIFIERILDKKIVEYNNKGYLNGHVPFSSSIAFLSYLVAYMSNKKYIILSNESSANEATVLGTNINHQYSKSYDFEKDFIRYTKKTFKIGLEYFSFLRPISEYQIGMIFSQMKNYHSKFKSCNIGSKQNEWDWCCKCPKCLFVFILLSPFLYKDQLIQMFGNDLFESKELLNMFKEILGYSDNKPFECVGTYQEARYAVSTLIKQTGGKLPYLLKYYKDNYPLEFDSPIKYDRKNNLPAQFEKILKEELKKYEK